MKTILLIGKTGQLGSEIIKSSVDFGYEAVAFDREELDVNNEAQLKEKIKLIKPDILINTAAFNSPPVCETEPNAALATNFVAVNKMARICKDNNIKFVTYSTDYVFDGEKGSLYEEDDLPNPLQVYGYSKLAGECAAVSTYPQGSMVIRTCGVYGGEKGSPEKGNFVLNVMKGSEDKEFVEVSSEQIVSPTFAGDLCVATLKLLNRGALGGIYHLVNEGYCSWYEFAVEIFKLAGINKEVKPFDRGGVSGNLKRPKFSALKNIKAKSLGVELPSWQAGLKTYFDFLNNIK